MTAKYGNLHMLVDQIRGPESGRLAELPSWYPDWSLSANPAIHGHAEDEISIWDVVCNFGAAQPPSPAATNSAHNIVFSSDNLVLGVEGFVLDTVETLSECFPSRKSFRGSKICEDALGIALGLRGGPYWSFWRNKQDYTVPDYEKHLQFTHLSQEHIYAQTTDQLGAFWRTMVADSFPLQSNAFYFVEVVANDVRAVQGRIMYQIKDTLTIHPRELEAMDFDQRQRALGYPFQKAIETFEEPSRNRRFFMSYNNHMGLAPAETLEGDLVCVIFGTDQLVVLRQVLDHYIFIGIVYLHGWSKGEVVELCKRDDIPVQCFNIH
jgi:hypothetical protein